MEERYNLAIDRMKAIIEEKTVAEPYREYFQHVARFILKLDELKQNVESGKQKEMSEEELQEEMKDLLLRIHFVTDICHNADFVEYKSKLPTPSKLDYNH